MSGLPFPRSAIKYDVMLYQRCKDDPKASTRNARELKQRCESKATMLGQGGEDLLDRLLVTEVTS